MSDFLSSIKNIAAVSTVVPVSRPGERAQIANIIQNAAIDSVNFSNESKNLFQISQIDRQFDQIFGIPKDLSASQQEQLHKLGNIANNLFSSGALQRQLPDSDTIMENIKTLFADQTLSGSAQKQLASLSTEVQSYLQNLSITQLTSGNQNNFFLNNQDSTLQNITLSDSEKQDLGKIAQQLNRLLFVATDAQSNSFLDSINSLYGLNNPSTEDQQSLTSLLTQRNTLFSSLLLNRNVTYSYGDLYQ